MKIGKYIKELREQRNLSINQLSIYSDVSAAHISRIERGLREPSPEILRKLSPILKVTYEDLMKAAGYLGGNNIDDKSQSKLENKNIKTLGDRLKYLREKTDKTQTMVAKDLKITTQAYSQYERDVRIPDSLMIQKLADYYNVSTDYLLGRKDTYTGKELLKHIPDEYKESFKKLNIKQLKFVKKMADDEIDPDVLIDTMNKIKEYYEKLNNNKINK